MESAGTWASPGLPVLLRVSKVAQTYGLDLSPHRSIKIDEPMLSTSDLVLVMEASHKEALHNEFPSYSEHIHLFSQVVTGRFFDIPDLVGDAQEVEKVSADLERLIRLGLDNICKLAISLQGKK